MWNRFNKTDRRILSVAMMLMLLMLYLLYDDALILPSDDSNAPTVAQVANIDNDVRRKVSRQFLWRSARNNETVRLGDSIFTGQGSQVVLQFKDGRKLVIQENSMIVLNTVGDQLTLDLQFGRFSGDLGSDIKITVQGKEVAANGSVEVDSDGTIRDPKAKKATDVIVWENSPPTNFYHFKHNAPMKLSWTSQKSFGRYKLQFSTSKDFSQIAYQESTRRKEVSTMGYPSNGKFFVRVVGENTKGQAEDFSVLAETNIQELDAPQILSPKMNETLSYRTDADGDLLNLSVAPVQWNYPLSNVTYEVQLASDPEFTTVVWKNQLLDKNALTPALNPGTYFLRVRDYTPTQGTNRPWSPVTEFKVEFEQPVKFPAPELVTKKIDYSAPSPQDVVFVWKPVEGAPQYIVHVSNSPDFAAKQAYATAETRFVYKDYLPGKSFFRVFASSKKGRVGDSSETGDLNVRVTRPILDPIEPRIVRAKTYEDPGDPQEFTLSWTDLKLADQYVIQVAEDPEFRRRIQLETESPQTKVTIQKPGQYYVRVKGVTETGEAMTKYSDTGILNYKLRIPLQTPVLTEPLDQMTLFFQKTSSPFLWLEWQPVRAALTYNIEVALDPNFSQKILSVSTKSRRYLIKEKLPQGVLYWRVQATGEADEYSNWSSPRGMTVFSGRAPVNRLPAGRRR